MTTLLERIQQLVSQLPGYSFYFDERTMFNVQADDVPFPCVFFEEYREGRYTHTNWLAETTRVQLYFCKLVQMENNGIEREKIREEIKEEALIPFINLLNSNPQLFDRVENYKFFTPPPRFDTNEVSILLEFEATTRSC